MANEATLFIETNLPISMTCAEAVTIEKGTICKLSGDFTVAVTAAAEDIFGGITAETKIGGDGKTKVAVYRDGIFKMVAIAAITAGHAVSTSATANKVQAATKTAHNSEIIGVALTASGGDGNTLLVEVRPGFNNNAYA
jgi:hypothetical protein